MWLKPGIIAAASGVVALARRTPPPYFFSTTIFPAALTYNPNGTSAATRWGTTYNTSTFRPTGTQYYVSTTGDDTNGNGSSGSPWATLQHAHDTAAAGSRIMVAPGRYAQVAITKNISFEATTADTVYVGTFLKNSDVATWGTLASGRQQVTLNSGYIYGFVDLSETYSEPDLRNYPKVAQHSPTAATDIAVSQTHSRPGIYVPKSSASYLGAASGRDLTNSFDTALLAWANSSTNRPFTIAAGLTVYSYGIFWVGGKERTIGTSGSGLSTLFVMEKGGALGQGSDNTYDNTAPSNTDQVIKSYGTFVMKDSCVIGSNLVYQDAIDFDSQGGSSGMYLNSVIGQGGNRSGDQASTTHQIKYGILCVNSVMFDSASMIGDIGPTLAGYFGLKCLNGPSSKYGPTLYQAGAGNDVHFSDIVITGTVGSYDYGNQATDYAYDYDHSIVGLRSPGPGTILDYYNQTDPTGDSILAQIIVDPAYLYQTSDTSQPVTASGQAVGRIQDPSNPSQYWTVPYGALTYVDDGVHKRLDTNTVGRIALNGRSTPFGVSDAIIGIKSSDTSYTLFGNEIAGLHKWPEVFSSGQFPTNAAYCTATTATYKVDNVGPKTTKTQMLTAINTGAAHVVSAENIDLSHSMWNRLSVLGSSGSTQGASYDFTGSMYGLIIQRHTGNATFLNSSKATVAAASGVTLS